MNGIFYGCSCGHIVTELSWDDEVGLKKWLVIRNEHPFMLDEKCRDVICYTEYHRMV